MLDILQILLIVGFTSGQLLKIPFGINSGITLLDLSVIILSIFGLINLKRKIPKPSLWFVFAICFILIATISLIFTPLRLNFKEYFISFSYILRFFLYALLGFLIYCGAISGFKRNIISILTFCGLVLAVTGLIQLIFLPDLMFLSNFGWDPHYFRAAATFLDPNFLGSFLVLSLILIFQKFTTAKKWNKIEILSFALIYIALLTTFSRGAYLAFLVSFLYISMLRKSVKATLVTILLFGVLLLGFTTYQRLIAQPRGINREQSAEFRLGSWRQGWEIFSQNPILGVGFNAYRFALNQYGLSNEQFFKSHGSSTNDSSLLYVAATTGIVGLIIYLLFLGSFFYRGSHLLNAGLICLITQSFFANTLFYPPLILWIFLIKAADIKD
ncbi:hypothetical protein A3D79_02020 [Candidatus Daviesbacteria bacterium RIFCSPHIGHO2_02_FULL_39_8]|nr:MAG: hypothetical protein A3D79_02020 [Candidatus Daviesbacteria bacterium RIFCSPHIGHO2_02_FULL_39_8]